MSNWIIIGLIGMYCIGLILGFGLGKDRVRDQAVQTACAQYNPETSDFEWIRYAD